MGKFVEKPRKCFSCGNVYTAHEEKWTDVNIGLYLLNMAYTDTYDIALILSGDGDFLPAITMTKQAFPAKRIGILFPPRRVRNDLKKVADFSLKIDKVTIQSCRYPDTIALKNGKRLFCPPEWK